jgi:heptosyltransferase II
LRRLKKNHPNNPIWLVVRQGVEEPFGSLNHIVDQVFVVEKGNWSTYRALQKKWKNTFFEFIFSPHESFTSARFIFGLNAKNKISYKKYWNFLFYSHRLIRNWNLPEALRILDLLTPFDDELKNLILDYLQNNKRGNLSLVPDWSSQDIAEKWVSQYQNDQLRSPYAVIFPGSTWPTKQWTVSGFADLIKELSLNHQVVLLGSKSEIPLAKQILSKANVGNVISLVGDLSLNQSIDVVKKAEFVISNDSGGQHLAALMSRTVVSIFGPTTLDLGFRPWTNKLKIVENLNLSCRPCGVHGHKACPLSHHRCMVDISSQQVLEAIKSLRQIP